MFLSAVSLDEPSLSPRITAEECAAPILSPDALYDPPFILTLSSVKLTNESLFATITLSLPPTLVNASINCCAIFQGTDHVQVGKLYIGYCFPIGNGQCIYSSTLDLKI